jgi:hypothetical protein
MVAQLAPRFHYRQLHLIDVENLVGSPYFCATDVVNVRRRYDRLIEATDWDQVFVATSARSNALDAGLGWGEGRMTFAPGENGAERALLDIAPLEFAASFKRVVIASGDHYFAEYAAALGALNVSVTVVSRWGALSRQLRLAASDHRYIDDATTIPTPPFNHNGAGVAA